MVVGIVSIGLMIMDVRFILLIVLKDFVYSKGMFLVYVYYYGGVRVEVNGLDVDEVEVILKSRSFIEVYLNDIGVIVYYLNVFDDFFYDFFKCYNFKIGGKVFVDVMNIFVVFFFFRFSEYFGFEVEFINDMMISYILLKLKEVFFYKLNKGDYIFGLCFRLDGIVEFYKDGEEKMFMSMWFFFDYFKRVFK